jgi:hypothetical protein
LVFRDIDVGGWGNKIGVVGFCFVVQNRGVSNHLVGHVNNILFILYIDKSPKEINEFVRVFRIYWLSINCSKKFKFDCRITLEEAVILMII